MQFELYEESPSFCYSMRHRRTNGHTKGTILHYRDARTRLKTTKSVDSIQFGIQREVVCGRQNLREILFWKDELTEEWTSFFDIINKTANQFLTFRHLFPHNDNEDGGEGGCSSASTIQHQSLVNDLAQKLFSLHRLARKQREILAALLLL